MFSTASLSSVLTTASLSSLYGFLYGSLFPQLQRLELEATESDSRGEEEDGVEFGAADYK